MYLFYRIKESISTIPIIITNWHSCTSYYYLYLRYFPYLINSNTEKYYCQLLIFSYSMKGKCFNSEKFMRMLGQQLKVEDRRAETLVANQQYADFLELRHAIS